MQDFISVVEPVRNWGLSFGKEKISWQRRGEGKRKMWQDERTDVRGKLGHVHDRLTSSDNNALSHLFWTHTHMGNNSLKDTWAPKNPRGAEALSTTRPNRRPSHSTTTKRHGSPCAVLNNPIPSLSKQAFIRELQALAFCATWVQPHPPDYILLSFIYFQPMKKKIDYFDVCMVTMCA